MLNNHAKTWQTLLDVDVSDRSNMRYFSAQGSDTLIYLFYIIFKTCGVRQRLYLYIEVKDRFYFNKCLCRVHTSVSWESV